MRLRHPSHLCALIGLFCAMVPTVGRVQEAPAFAPEGLSPGRVMLREDGSPSPFPWGPAHFHGAAGALMIWGFCRRAVPYVPSHSNHKGAENVYLFFSSSSSLYWDSGIHRKFYFPASHADGGGQEDRWKWKSLNTASGKLFKGVYFI